MDKLDDPDYIFKEGELLEDVKRYINSTYDQHYASGKIQSTEFTVSNGYGMAFFLANIQKYSSRYGKKDGFQRKDLLKVCHYAIMALYVHDEKADIDCYIDVDKKHD